MGPITTSIITSIAVNYFTHLSAPSVEKFFRKAIEIDPTLEEKILTADTTEKIQNVFEDATNIIEATAGSGGIEIGGLNVVIEAIKMIKFDHENGNVTMNGAVLKAPTITTGSEQNESTGQTIITNTEMNTRGTRISVGPGAHIKISGNATIKQS